MKIRNHYMNYRYPKGIAKPRADIIRPFMAQRTKYIGIFFVGNHLMRKSIRSLNNKNGGRKKS